MESTNTVVIDDDSPITAALSDSLGKQARTTTAMTINTEHAQREVGDQVNRFLLCVLVSESAKNIKASAEKAGEALPLATIVRGVLRSYRLAAKDKYGPFAESEPDMAGLRRLNEKVLRSEIARRSQDRVKNDKARLVPTERPVDDTRIRPEIYRLGRKVELRDRLTK
jgi:hypothetical protein